MNFQQIQGTHYVSLGGDDVPVELRTHHNPEAWAAEMFQELKTLLEEETPAFRVYIVADHRYILHAGHNVANYSISVSEVREDDIALTLPCSIPYAEKGRSAFPLFTAVHSESGIMDLILQIFDEPFYSVTTLFLERLVAILQYNLQEQNPASSFN